MTDEDVDLLIMLHRIGYSIDGVRSRVESSMVVKGKSSNDTAMAFTVGYPVAIATELLAKGKVSQRGVILPLKKELYEPILAGLASQGLRFDERVIRVED
jgi:saccharopine dehydrogenase-like NADP-dependent oxidoreductase